VIRAWLVDDAAARRWAEGALDDDELLTARPLADGAPAALYVARVEGRATLARVIRLCLARGWGLACVDACHYHPWRWEVVNGPARYASAAWIKEQASGLLVARGAAAGGGD
jgi:hypothetical protein